MPQAAGQADLAQEPALQRARFGTTAVGGEELDCDLAVMVAIVGHPDDAHSAPAQFVRQLVPSKAPPHRAPPPVPAPAAPAASRVVRERHGAPADGSILSPVTTLLCRK